MPSAERPTPSASPQPARRAPFVWPPVKADPVPPAEDPRPQSGPRSGPTARETAHPLRALWRDVESAWLSPVSLPLNDRINMTAWQPDAPGLYCERCGQSVGAGELSSRDPEFGCGSCRGARIPWNRFVRLGPYESHLAEWVQEVKFSRCHWLARQLGESLAAQITASGALGTDPAARVRIVVVPVPTSVRRRLARGIDHSRAIAIGVSRGLDAPIAEPLWREHRPTQRSLSPTARETNLAGSIHPRRSLNLAGRTVVLVDDVSTTGATLRAAVRGLREAPKAIQPASVIAAVLAVTPDHARRAAVPTPIVE